MVFHTVYTMLGIPLISLAILGLHSVYIAVYIWTVVMEPGLCKVVSTTVSDILLLGRVPLEYTNHGGVWSGWSG